MPPTTTFQSTSQEHLRFHDLTGWVVKASPCNSTAMHHHLLGCHHSPSLDDFSMVYLESNDFKLTLTEECCDNRTIKSIPLELFWNKFNVIFTVC